MGTGPRLSVVESIKEEHEVEEEAETAEEVPKIVVVEEVEDSQMS